MTWLLITLPLWLSPFHPAVVAYFIIAFDLYFFYKSIKTAYYATLSYKLIQLNGNFPYIKKINNLKQIAQVKHFIIIPNYQESLNKLDETIKCIIDNQYPNFNENIFLILAFESREIEAKDKADYLINKYQKSFKEIFVTYHPLLPNEAPGKASNQTYAAKIVDNYVEKSNWDRKNVLITICDADSLLSKNYLTYLTYKFLKDKDKKYHFYWAPVLLYNNFWKLPLFVRVQATLSSIGRLAYLSQLENLIQVSTYSTNLWLLKQINFWDVDIIPEDWHVYLQAFFIFGEKTKTIPLYTLINSDAVYSGNIYRTMKNRYEQEKRWAWGVSDIGYALKKFFVSPHINLIVKLKKIFFIAEHHLFWPSSFFILTISASIPPLINPAFKRTVLGFILPQLSGLILTLTSVLLILYVYLDVKIRQKINQKTQLKSIPLLFIQWYLLPIISFFFSSLPALEAHTRLLLGKKIKYKVTEKV